MNEASLELMPPRLRAHVLISEETQNTQQAPVHVTMSSKDTVKSLAIALSNAVRTSNSDRPTRIWKLPESDDFSFLEYPVPKLKEGAKLLDADDRKTLEEALIDSGDALVVEFEAEHGWLAPDTESQVQASGASTPQSTASGTALQKLFGSSNFFDKLQSTSYPSGTDVKSDSTALKPALSIIKSGFSRAKFSRIEPGTLGLGNM